jgi:hypothetical protein
MNGNVCLLILTSVYSVLYSIVGVTSGIRKVILVCEGRIYQIP